jgi:murein DD-endopeptidase MepM/ murein hydrolase activator NlpD
MAMRVWQALAIGMAAVLWSWPAGAQVGSVQSIGIRMPVAPQAVRVGETTHVFYELHLTNYASSAVTLTDLTVLDANSSAVLKRFEGDALAALLVRPTAALDTEPRAIPSGMYGALYMTLPLEQPLPSKLTHRVRLSVPLGRAQHTVTLNSDVSIDSTPLPELGPPLRGGTWAALYDPAMERGHRRVMYAVDGHVHLPGRFAIDFLGVDANGKTFRGTGERPSDYFGYGADVLAVSDGVIVATRDDFTEPPSEHVSIGDATGVFVTLDIGGGRYAFYEHLQPGLAVKVGQKVRRGDRLGKLGFTGQAQSPHLHFHVANATAPLAAEGMPYHFTRYRLLGQYNSISDFGAKPWQALPAARVISKSLPAPNVVVSFD